jgi:hypothetical protein
MREFLEMFLGLFRSAPDITKMGFLTSFFRTGSEDVVPAEYVDIDIERSDEDVGPVLRDYKTGSVVINEDIYVNKQIKPPQYDLERPVNVYDLMKRQPGETEYAKVGSWLARLMVVLNKTFIKMADMIKRSIELQAAQVLQTGRLDLLDENGAVAYQLDYRPKSTHFPMVTVDWSEGASTPIDDLRALASVIRDDGLYDPKILIMGEQAYMDFIAKQEVKELFKQDELALGRLSPQIVNKGGNYMGYIFLGSYRYEIFTYNGRYIPYNGGAKRKFLDDNKVIMLCDPGDLEFRLVFGDIPSIGMEEPFSQFVSDRVTVEGSIDLHPYVYRDDRRKTYAGQLASRPICIPVSIDRFGCLSTRQPE